MFIPNKETLKHLVELRLKKEPFIYKKYYEYDCIFKVPNIQEHVYKFTNEQIQDMSFMPDVIIEILTNYLYEQVEFFGLKDFFINRNSETRKPFVNIILIVK